MKTLTIFAAIAMLSFAGVQTAGARPTFTGKTLKTITTGCSGTNGCHATQNASVVVTINGPDQLAPGATGTYTCTIAGGGGSPVAVDIATSTGTISPADNNLKTSAGELITNGVKTQVNGAYTYTFKLTAPMMAGSVTLYAVGVSSKPMFNWAPSKVVTVASTMAADQPMVAHSPVTLEQNYPNPFNPSTVITYTVAEATHVNLAVYNSDGVKVGQLADDTRLSGTYTANFNASTLPSGVYWYQLSATLPDGTPYTLSRRMLLAK